MSEHIAKVVRVYKKPHNNADTLSLVEIGGFQAIVRSDDWEDGSLGCYITPDTIVDGSRPEFSFLGEGKHRIKCKRLRGQWSMGLLVPAPEGSVEDQDLYEYFGLSHYEPEMEHISTGGNFAKPPRLWGDMTKYDIENGRKKDIRNLFIDGEEVCVSSKLNGSNCGFVFSDGEMYVKSRSGFRTKEDNVFWKALEVTPSVEKFCRENPDYFVYGEVYGQVKGFRYDLIKNEQCRFRCFDVMSPNRQYLNHLEFIETCQDWSIPIVPQLGIYKFNYEQLLEMAETKCPLNNHISEGIVVKPILERRDYSWGRVFCKIVSNRYMEKS